MRIAVAAEASDADAPVSFHGGRAPICLVFDECGELLHSFANPFAQVGRHAEHEVSRMMLEQHVDVMVAPLFGPTMIEQLSAQGIRCIATAGAVRKVVLQLDIWIAARRFRPP